MSATYRMLDAAFAAAERGWPVFPCAPRGKHPKTSDGLKAATTDRDQLTAWWTRWPHANPAVHLGRAGLVVLDIDGPTAATRYGELITELGAAGPPHATDGASVQTGRAEGSGYHLYFHQHPGGEVPHIENLGGGLECRTGEHYCMLPGAVHPTGRVYRWLDRPPVDGLPALTEPWRGYLRELKRPAAPPPAVTPVFGSNPAHGNQLTRARLRGVLGRLAAAREGERNRLTYWAARRCIELHQAGDLPNLDAALTGVQQLAVDLGLPVREVDATLDSARTAGGAA